MKKKIYKYLKILMLTILFLFMIFFQGNHRLWLDELDWSIGIVDAGRINDVYNKVLGSGENLPLFYLFLYFIRNKLGLNDIWVMTLLTATSFTIIGAIGVYKITKDYFDEKINLLSVFLLFTFYSVIAMCAWQLRPYGMLFCFSAWTLYYYLKRIEVENWKNILLFALFMVLMMNSHWFGVLLALMYAIIDFVLFIRKKISLKCIVAYFIALLVFLPSFIKLLVLHKGDIGTYGVEFLNLKMLTIVSSFISGEQLIYLIMLIISIIVAFIRIVMGKENTSLTIIFSSSVILFILVCLYSFLNKSGGIVRARYFVVIIPHVIILLSWFMKLFFEKLLKYRYIKPTIVILIIVLVFTCIIDCYTKGIYTPNYHGIGYYLFASRYLQKQDDIYKDDTIIICPYGKTWVYQYWVEEGIKLPSNIIVVDPLEHPNQMDMAQQSIDKFEYVVRDGKIVDSEKVNDFDKYNTIYYFEQYRRIDDNWKKSIQLKFQLVYENKEFALEKYIK